MYSCAGLFVSDSNWFFLVFGFSVARDDKITFSMSVLMGFWNGHFGRRRWPSLRVPYAYLPELPVCLFRLEFTFRVLAFPCPDPIR